MSNPSLSVKAVNIPGWAQFFGTVAGRITKASQAYSRIPIVRRGVNILPDSVVSLPYSITRAGAAEGEAEDAGWPFENDFETLLGDTVKAYLIEGAAYWLKQKNRVMVRSLQWLNPTTVSVELVSVKENGTLNLKFTQSDASGTRAGQPNSWTSEEIVYFRQWQIEDDVQPGPSVVACVLDAARLHYYLTRFGKNTFESGAMPVVVMGVDGNPSVKEMERAEGIFKQMLTGIENAFRVVVLRGIFKPQVVTPPLNTLAMPELAAYALGQVALGMGIPETQLTDAANFATAEIHDLQFWRNTVIPLANIMAHAINTQLLTPMGLELNFDPEQMDVFQEDENQRANSLVSLTDAGFPLDWAAQMLGYDLPEGKSYEDLQLLMEKRRASAPPAQPQPSQLATAQPQETMPPKEVTPPGTEPVTKRATLRAWRRFVENRLKAGKSLDTRAFETDALEPSLQGAIKGSLEGASLAESKQIFDEVLEAYP